MRYGVLNGLVVKRDADGTTWSGIYHIFHTIYDTVSDVSYIDKYGHEVKLSSSGAKKKLFDKSVMEVYDVLRMIYKVN